MKLRGRFTLTLALAALVPIALAAYVTRQVIVTSAREEYRSLRNSAELAIRGVLERHKHQVDEVVKSLASKDHPYVAGMLRDQIKHMLTPRLDEARQQARPWMEGLALDVLTIVDDSEPANRVLVAPHLRSAHDGHDDAEVRRRAHQTSGRPYYWLEEVQVPSEPGTSGTRPTAVILVAGAARLSIDGGRSLGVMAGRRLIPELLAAVVRPGRIDARVVKVGKLDVAAHRIGDGAVLVPAVGTDWDALAVNPPIVIPLEGPDGTTIARLEVAVSDAELHGVLRKITYISTGLALGALGAVVLLGLWVARRTARDLDALVEGSLAAARGDLDHRVPVRSRDEVGAVASAFNLMMEDLRTAKERLMIAERIAAWQEIARRLAHEIKNPLTPIQMAMDTLRKSHAKRLPAFDEILEESTQTVLAEVDRLKRTVTAFSDLARMPKPELATIDLNEVVRSSLGLYSGAVALETQLGALPRIEADRGQLGQVVLNLLENARDAIATRGDGKISVTTRLGEAGDRVMLIVEDNGPGVPLDHKERIFTPYFSTKLSKGGTGLGLAIVHHIVSDHGGRITLSDAPGGGARFSIELPLQHGPTLLASRS